MIYLHAMILFVTDVNETKSIGGDTPRIIESSISRALWPEGSQKSARRIEHLYTMIVTISDDKLPDSVDRNTGKTIELTLTASIGSKLLHEISIPVEHLIAN